MSVVESAICFAAICWGRSISTRDSKRLNKLIKKAGSVLGTDLDPEAECWTINNKQYRSSFLPSAKAISNNCLTKTILG